MANNSITISGRVFVSRSLEEIYPARPVPKFPQPGDIMVWCRLDNAGRAAVKRGNRDYGCSGNFQASIFDGQKWRKFHTRNFVRESITKYATHCERGWKIELMIEALEMHADEVVALVETNYQLSGSLSGAMKAQDRAAAARAREVAESKLLGQEIIQSVELIKQRKFKLAYKLLCSAEVVEGRVRLMAFESVSGPVYQVDLKCGLRGLLSSKFLKCDESDRRQRCESIKAGDVLRVRISRIRDNFGMCEVELVEDGADLPREIRRAYQSCGEVFQVTVIDTATNKDGCFGLFVRVMDQFRALLHVNAMAGKTRAERLRRLQELREVGRFPAKLLAVDNNCGVLRINVGPLPSIARL